MIALAVDEERRRLERAHHVQHRCRLQLGDLPVALLRAAVEDDACREIVPPAADHDRIASALAHAHERDALRGDARMALQEIERRVDHRCDLGVGQDHARSASAQRRLVAFPAREQIRRERHVAVLREALGEVERVLCQAVALVQDDDRARGCRLARQTENAFAVPAEAHPLGFPGHAISAP